MSTAPAVTAAELIAREGAPSACEPLPHAIVELTGADVRRFANGMFTNNVRDLPVGGVQRNAMVDERARVLGLLELGCLAEDRFVAVLEGVDPAAFIERYDGFVFADDVTFAHRAELRGLTVQGPGARAALEAAGVPVPDRDRLVAFADGFVAWRDRTGLGGFDVFASAIPDGIAAPFAPGALEVLRVRARQVRWPVDFGEKSLPHEMGMREAFLAFDKGCYVGQESIHRIDVQGQVRRHLTLLRLDALVAHGSDVLLGEKVVGRVTSPVVAPEGAIALAVLREPASEPGAEVVVVDGDRRVRAIAS